MYVLYQETVANLLHSRQSTAVDVPALRGEMFSVGDMVLLKDHMEEKLTPQYSHTYWVIKKIGDKTVDIIDQQGKTRRATFPQLKKVTPTEALLTKIPVNMKYGRQAKYLKSSLPEVLRNISIEARVGSTTQRNGERTVKRRLTARRTGTATNHKFKVTAWRHRLRPRKLKRKL